MATHHLDDTQPHAFWDNTLPPRIRIAPGDTVVFAPGKYGFRLSLTKSATAAAPHRIAGRSVKRNDIELGIHFGATE